MTTITKLPERIDPVKAGILGDCWRGMGLWGKFIAEASEAGNDCEINCRVYLDKSHLMTVGLNPSTWTDEERAEVVAAAIRRDVP